MNETVTPTVEVVDIQFRPGQKVYFFDPAGLTLHPGDHVITTALEHNSVLRPLFALEDAGTIELSVVSADRRGCVNYEDFAALVRPNTRAIVCTHASNLTGNALDLYKIGAIAKAPGAYIVLAIVAACVSKMGMGKWNYRFIG